MQYLKMRTPRLMVKTLVGWHPLWCVALHQLTLPSCCEGSWKTQFYFIQYQIFKYTKIRFRNGG